MTITHHLPSALIAAFPSPQAQADWLAANLRYQLLGRIIRPQSAKGETFAVLVEHATIERAAVAQLNDARDAQLARRRYMESLKSPENRAARQRSRYERKWGQPAPDTFPQS